MMCGANIPDRFHCPRCGQPRHVPESNLIVRCPHSEEGQKRRRAARDAQRGTDTQETPKGGRSGHENRECGEITPTDESW